MKKLLCVFTILVCPLLSYIISFSFSIQDKIAWDSFGKGNRGISMYLNQVEIEDPFSFKDRILTLANEYNVSVLMSGLESIDGQEVLWKGVDAKDQIPWKVYTNNGREIRFDQQEAPFLFKTGRLPNDIKDAFNDDQAVFLDLSTAIDEYGVKNEYYLEGDSASVFVQDVAEFLQVDISDIYTQTAFHTRGFNSSLSYYAMLSMIILVLLYIIVLLAYLTNAQRKISILCIHGFSQLAVETSFFLPIFWVFVFCALLCSIGAGIYASSFELFMKLLLVHGGLLFALLIVYAIAFRAGIHQSLQNLLKGKKRSS